MVLTCWELFWNTFSLTWLLLILAAICKPTNIEITNCHRVIMTRQVVAADWGDVWWPILQFSPYSQSLSFPLETTHTHRFSHSCSASLLYTSGFNWPLDFAVPHKLPSSRPTPLAPIHCSHLGKPESVSALESFTWIHYRAAQSPASLQQTK